MDALGLLVARPAAGRGHRARLHERVTGALRSRRGGRPARSRPVVGGHAARARIATAEWAKYTIRGDAQRSIWMLRTGLCRRTSARRRRDDPPAAVVAAEAAPAEADPDRAVRRIAGDRRGVVPEARAGRLHVGEACRPARGARGRAAPTPIHSVPSSQKDSDVTASCSAGRARRSCRASPARARVRPDVEPRADSGRPRRTAATSRRSSRSAPRRSRAWRPCARRSTPTGRRSSGRWRGRCCVAREERPLLHAADGGRPVRRGVIVLPHVLAVLGARGTAGVRSTQPRASGFATRSENVPCEPGDPDVAVLESSPCRGSPRARSTWRTLRRPFS